MGAQVGRHEADAYRRTVGWRHGCRRGGRSRHGATLAWRRYGLAGLRACRDRCPFEVRSRNLRGTDGIGIVQRIQQVLRRLRMRRIEPQHLPEGIDRGIHPPELQLLVREVVADLRTVGVEHGSPREGVQRLVEPAQVVQCVAPTIMERSDAVVRRQYAFEAGERLRRAPLSDQQAAEVQRRRQVVRHGREHFAPGGLRRRGFTGQPQQVAEVEARVDQPWLAFEGRAERRDRGGCIPGRMTDHAQVMAQVGIVGRQPHGACQAGDGVLVPASGRQREPEVRMGIGDVGPERNRLLQRRQCIARLPTVEAGEA